MKEIFNFKLDPEMKKVFKEKAEEDGRSMSNALRFLISKYIHEK